MAVAANPADAPGLRWGIIGAGFIVGKFVNAVTKHTASTVVAVGSRDAAKAGRFAAEHGVPTAHGGYQALVEDPQVDAIYVATPHSHHRDHALLAIGAGKAVLIEKPMARNAAEAQQIVDAARAAGVFAMEAMWTRFLPHMAALRDAIASGELGEVVYVHADHGQKFAFDPVHRIYNPGLAGGALLDLGVYPVSFVHDVLGEPERVAALGVLTETGVDGQVSLALGYAGRAQATVSTTMWALTGISAAVVGEAGRASFTGPFLRPTTVLIDREDGSRKTFDGEVRNGFQYEIAEVARCVADGRTESDVHSLDHSVAVLRTLDEARRQVGVRYPGESLESEQPPLMK